MTDLSGLFESMSIKHLSEKFGVDGLIIASRMHREAVDFFVAAGGARQGMAALQTQHAMLVAFATGVETVKAPQSPTLHEGGTFPRDWPT
jgi:hypothetical protein